MELYRSKCVYAKTGVSGLRNRLKNELTPSYCELETTSVFRSCVIAQLGNFRLGCVIGRDMKLPWRC